MRKKSFQKAFQTRSQETVRLLGRLPLSDVNRLALETAARRVATDALLAANFLLVRSCHDVSVLASTASGPGIPEGAARLRELRAALRRAVHAAGLSEASEGLEPGDEGPGFPGCPCSRIQLVRGRLALPSAAVERAVSLGRGLRILRFRPRDLKKSPRELSERLSRLAARDDILGLYAVTGKKPGAPAREFVLLVPDFDAPDDSGMTDPDPLIGLPVTGRIRTLLAAGENSMPDLSGFEVEGSLSLPQTEARPVKGKEAAWKAARPRSSGPAALGVREAAAGKFPQGSPQARALRAGVRLDGEYRNATVLYADLPGLLQACRGLEPWLASETLNRVLSRLSRCVEAADGVVDAFVGSSLFAFWGAPSASGRDAAAAARAALAMRRILRLVNRGRIASGSAPLRLACGLESSPVLAGSFGPAKRLSYSVAGEATRGACRIGCRNEALGTDILVSEYTLRLMGHSFLALPVDSVRTDDKTQPVRVYALLGRRGDPGTPKDVKGLRELLGNS